MIVAIILCGALSIVYGVWAVRSVMAADPGNARMQEIAAAIQEGATAYLTRQYTTIAIAGVIIFAIVWWLLGLPVAIGFLIGAVLSGTAGFVGMMVSVRANVRTAQAASQSLAAGLEIAFRSGAVTGLLVAGLALLGRRRLLRHPDRHRRARQFGPHGDRLAGRARLRRLADLDLRPPRRRHLHQGRRRRRRPRRQGRGRHPRGRPAQPGHHRRQCRRQCRRLRRHGGRPLRDLCGHRRRHDGAGLDLLRRLALCRVGDDLPAGDLRRLRRHHDHRHVRGKARGQPEHHGRALQGLLRHGRAVAGGAAAGDLAGLPRRALDRLPGAERHLQWLGPVLLRRRRAGGDRVDHRHHRVLHRHELSPGALGRAVIGDGARHQRHPGPRHLARVRRRCRRWSSSPASSSPSSWPASTASRSRSRPCWRWPAWWWRSTPSAR